MRLASQTTAHDDRSPTGNHTRDDFFIGIFLGYTPALGAERPSLHARSFAPCADL